jgi:hypothetical protein
MELDASVVPERVARMTRGLGAYAGEDRFIGHIRELISPLQSVSDFTEQITRPSHVVLQQLEDRKPPRPQKNATKPRVIVLFVGLSLVMVAVALFVIFWK